MRAMDILVGLTAMLAFITSPAHTQNSGTTPFPFPTTPEPSPCCNANLMDSDGRVVLERGTPLTQTSAVFNVIKAKFCIRAPITFQLWAPSNQDVEETFYLPAGAQPEIYELVWQEQYMPSASTVAQLEEWIEIKLNQAIPVEPEMVLGLHSPSSHKFAVAYRFDDQRTPLYHSFTRGHRNLTLYQAMAFDTLPWPWTYYYNVRLCYQDPSGALEEFCINGDNPPYVVVGGPPGPPGSPGVPGPTGAPGTPGLPGENCLFSPDIPIQCSADEVLLGRLNDLEDATNDLINQINRGGGFNDNIITGTCPEGFRPGPFGVPYCYYFSLHAQQFGQMNFFCEEFKALPAFITSQMESDWIADRIRELMDMSGLTAMSFGTGGLKASNSDYWVWQVRSNEPEQRVNYTNWGTGQPTPIEGGLLQACLRITVNSSVNPPLHYWESYDCRVNTPFICKKLRACY